MVVKAYITDGYTEKAFIKGIPGMYEDVHFEYRRWLPQRNAGEFQITQPQESSGLPALERV